MKTDRLIDMLSANLEPVKHGRVAKSFAAALLVGMVSAFVVMLITVGPRSNLTGAATFGFVMAKLAIALVLVGGAAFYLVGLARPGRADRKWRAPILALVGVIALLAAALAFRHSTTPIAEVSATEWAVCYICVPLFAAIPFAALVWALRQAAPTRLRLTGACAGLAAGGIAAAYSLHCPIDSLPFVSGMATPWRFAPLLARCWDPGCCAGKERLEFDLRPSNGSRCFQSR